MSLKSSVNFSTKNTVFKEIVDGEQVYYYDNEYYPEIWTSNTPARKFYYPSYINPANISLSINGTLFSWPRSTKSLNTQKVSFPISLNKPDELKSQSQIEKEKEEKKKKEETELANENENQNEITDLKNVEDKEDKKENKTIEDFIFTIPQLIYKPVAPTIKEGLNLKITYSASANLTSQISYPSANLKKSDDFDWMNIRSFFLTLKSPVNLNSDLSYGTNFIKITNGISYSPVWQAHPYLSDDSKNGYTEKEIKNMKLADNKAQSQDIINTNKISINPFTYIDFLSDSQISWNSSIKLFRKNFVVTEDNEEWENKYLDFEDDNCVTVNSLSAVLSAKEFNKKIGQSVTFTAIMPPLLKQYNVNFGLSFPYVNFSLSTGLQQKTKDENVPENERWKKNPINESISISIPFFSKNVNFTQSCSYNQEDDYWESLKFSLSWNGISVSFLNSYATQYELDRESGWIPTEKDFKPYSLSFSYTPPTKTFYRWFNRISVAPSLNTSIVYDFLRPTNSYFIFSPSITFKLHKFMDLTFSTTSRNSVLYWYFHNEPGDFYNDGGFFPFNMFVDLFDSFRFDKNSLREKSGFKLKSLNMTLSHDLHDWKLNMTLKIEPRVITENGRKRYDFSPYFTIGVVWSPMESIKTTVTDKYGEFKIE